MECVDRKEAHMITAVLKDTGRENTRGATMPVTPEQQQWLDDIGQDARTFWRFVKWFSGLCRACDGKGPQEVAYEDGGGAKSHEDPVPPDPLGEGFPVIGDVKARRTNVCNLLTKVITFKGWSRGKELLVSEVDTSKDLWGP